MTWKYLKERAAVALSGVILAGLVILLVLLIASRAMEYRTELELQPEATPEITVPDVVWVTEIP